MTRINFFNLIIQLPPISDMEMLLEIMRLVEMWSELGYLLPWWCYVVNRHNCQVDNEHINRMLCYGAKHTQTHTL